MNKIVICKRCKKPEYWGEMRGISGMQICRDCYKAECERKNGELYIWNDLDGKRPTKEEYMRQEGKRCENMN